MQLIAVSGYFFKITKHLVFHFPGCDVISSIKISTHEKDITYFNSHGDILRYFVVRAKHCLK
jgi:hypothetical protein